MARTIDSEQLIARIMRLSHGDLRAQWTAAGIIRIIEEEQAISENASFLPLKSGEKRVQ